MAHLVIPAMPVEQRTSRSRTGAGFYIKNTSRTSWPPARTLLFGRAASLMRNSPCVPHILHVTQPVEGGVARVVTDLVRAQLAAGLRVTVACPQDGTLSDALRGAGLHGAALGGDPLAGPPTSRRGTAVGPDRVGTCGRDLVHAHSAKAGLAARLAVRGRIPTVFQPHAWSFEAVGGVTARLALGWERLGARWATRIVCVSEAERRPGSAPGSRALWRVDPQRRRHARALPARDGPHGRTAASGAIRAPLVVCVGRLCRQKGQDVLLRAWAEVAAAGAAAPGSCWSATARTRTGCAQRAPGSVRFAGAVARRRALVPGRRPRGPAVPLGGHGARPAGGDGLRPAGGGHRRGRGAGEPAAGHRAALPGAAGGPDGAGPGAVARCCSTRCCARRSAARAPARPGRARRAAHGGRGGGRVPRTARRRCRAGRRTHRVAGSPSTVTAESTVPLLRGSSRGQHGSRRLRSSPRAAPRPAADCPPDGEAARPRRASRLPAARRRRRRRPAGRPVRCPGAVTYPLLVALLAAVSMLLNARAGLTRLRTRGVLDELPAVCGRIAVGWRGRGGALPACDRCRCTVLVTAFAVHCAAAARAAARCTGAARRRALGPAPALVVGPATAARRGGGRGAAPTRLRCAAGGHRQRHPDGHRTGEGHGCRC